MKKVIICGSISAAEEILEVKKKLQEKGFEVEIPEGVKRQELRERTEVANEEKAEDKIKYDLIRGYFHKLKEYDIVLVVNPEKRDVANYIGGNTLIEMAFGYALEKPIYILYGIPDISYTSEILAMQPTVLNGNLAKVQL